jgi:hypothetical protein
MTHTRVRSGGGHATRAQVTGLCAIETGRQIAITASDGYSALVKKVQKLFVSIFGTAHSLRRRVCFSYGVSQAEKLCLF